MRTLSPRSTNPDGEIAIFQWPTMQKEAQGIAEIIHNQIKKDEVRPGQVLVLAPRRHFGYAIRDALNDINISSHSFFQEEELDSQYAQQAFTILTLLSNPDDRVALRCWCGLNSSTSLRGGWKRLQDHCSNSGETPYAALKNLISGLITIPYSRPLIKRFQELNRHLGKLKNFRGQILVDVLFPENEEWTTSLRSLASTIEENDFSAQTLQEHLRTQITQPELPTDVNYVRVMSLHKSKGLTADLVVVLGCIEGLIPSMPRQEITACEQSAILEEQRRLFYVAVTRTRKTLVLSSITQLPRGLAHKMNATVSSHIGNQNYASTFASRFLHDLGPSRPEAISGAEFLLRELV